MPEDFLRQTKTGDDEYTVKVNITWHYMTVMENARSEDTRRKMETGRDNLAREQNIPLLEKIIPLRDDIARKLGYRNFADYAIETRMARTGSTATEFLEKLKMGLQPKFDAELADFRALKIAETGDTNAQVRALGLALLRESAEETEVQRGQRTIARLLPVSAGIRRHVPDLPEHLRLEIRAR